MIVILEYMTPNANHSIKSALLIKIFIRLIDTNSICIIELVYRYINPYTLRTKEKQEDQKKLNIYTNWKNKLQSGELKKASQKE